MSGFNTLLQQSSDCFHARGFRDLYSIAVVRMAFYEYHNISNASSFFFAMDVITAS